MNSKEISHKLNNMPNTFYLLDLVDKIAEDRGWSGRWDIKDENSHYFHKTINMNTYLKGRLNAVIE